MTSSKRNAVLVLSGLFLSLLVMLVSGPAFVGCTPLQRENAVDITLKAQQAGCLVIRGLRVGGEDARDVCVALDEVRVAVEVLRTAIATARDAGADAATD